MSARAWRKEWHRSGSGTNSLHSCSLHDTFRLLPLFRQTTMSFLSNWRQRKHKDHDLEESEVLFEESEGLLGERRSSPPLGSISTADLSGTKSTKTNSRLTRPRLIPLVVGLCIFLAGAVYYRTHGSPIALAGLVSLKTPGCFTDFRGKPLVKAPMTKKVRDSLLPEQKYMTSFSSGTFC